MVYTQFKDIISTVVKNSGQKGTGDAIHRIICYYFKYIYGGYELPMVVERYYYDRLFLEIMLIIGKAEKYAEFNTKNMTKFDNIIRKTILRSKINSYEARRKLFFRWMGGEKNYQGYNEILSYLWKHYPSLNERSEVKNFLGLEHNCEALRAKLRTS